MQRYIILTRTGDGPFSTDWFDYENNWNPIAIEMVIDTVDGLYTVDGISWDTIEEDHL